MSTYILEIKFAKEFPKELQKFYIDYKCNGEDSGVDLVVPDNLLCCSYATKKINHLINCQMYKVKKDGKKVNVGYWLLPRSSISKTPLRMANSVGLIDMGYRGDIIGKVDTVYGDSYTVEKGTRLFQIASGDLTPISKVHVVEELSESVRGTGGFGSTGL